MAPADPNGRTVFVHWSRRGGGFIQAMFELAKLLPERPDLGISLNISNHNELVTDFAKLTPQVQLFDTFSSGRGALTGLPNFIARARRLVAGWKADGVRNVVVLMPHVWTPILGYFVRRAGLKYAVVVHDADPHPGDTTALLNRWLYSDIARTDVLFALSRSVAEKLRERWTIPAGRIVTLFHPVVTYSSTAPERPHAPLRVLFIGRIMAYKGLPLLIEAVEKLRTEGTPVSLGVAGEGGIAALRSRLAALNAEVVNEWLTHAQIDEVQSRYDVIVLPYVEASQSGVVMSAFGAGIPVIVTPVGGLSEQVDNGVTGLVAQSPSADAVADCIRRMASDRALYATLIANIGTRRQDFTVTAFAEKVLAALRG